MFSSCVIPAYSFSLLFISLFYTFAYMFGIIWRVKSAGTLPPLESLMWLVWDAAWAIRIFTYFPHLSSCFPPSFVKTKHQDSFLNFNLFFNWRKIALQCFIGFCHTTAWTSHNYSYIPSLRSFPPLSISHPSRLSWSVRLGSLKTSGFLGSSLISSQVREPRLHVICISICL